MTEVEERGGEVGCAGAGAVILPGKQREERRRCANGGVEDGERRRRRQCSDKEERRRRSDEEERTESGGGRGGGGAVTRRRGALMGTLPPLPIPHPPRISFVRPAISPAGVDGGAARRAFACCRQPERRGRFVQKRRGAQYLSWGTFCPGWGLCAQAGVFMSYAFASAVSAVATSLAPFSSCTSDF